MAHNSQQSRVCQHVGQKTGKLGRFNLMLAMTVLLGGCTSVSQYVHNGFKVGPNYGRAPAPVAPDWIDSTDRRIRKESDDLSHWWAVFNDPSLDNLVREAYQQNITLREAGFRIMQARAARGIAVGNLFPQQQFASGDYGRHAVSKLTANSSFLQKRFFDQWDMGLSMAWELDFWGRFRRAIEAADADLDASIEDYDDVLVILLGDVAETYTEMRVFQRELELVRANITLQRETLEIAQARFRGGNVSEVDVDQAQSILSQTESLVPQFESAARLASNRLCVLLGIPLQNLEQLIGPGPIPIAPTEVAVGIPGELLLRRPDIRRAERHAAAQCARIGIAQADLYPHISILGTYGFSAEKFTNLFKNKSQVGVVGPSFQWNILNYGRLVNNVRLQDAFFQELVAHYQNTVLNANAEVENGLITFLKAQERSIALVESVTAAQKAVQVSLVQYRGGILDFNRVATLEQNLVQQQDLLAQAQGNIASGLIQTYKALGGGWQIRLGDGPPPLVTPHGPPPDMQRLQEVIPAPPPANAPAKPPAIPRAAAAEAEPARQPSEGTELRMANSPN